MAISAPAAEFKKAMPVRMILPWVCSLVVVFALISAIFALETVSKPPQDTLDVRPVEVAQLPPPEPPPTQQQQTETQNTAAPGPSIDFLGAGQGPAIAFAQNPKLALKRMQTIEKPKIDKGRLDLAGQINVNFPLHTVEELDAVPQLISNNHVTFPRRMRENGIDKVATQVEIIIDSQGKAYVKKIVDPVYPEMIEVIRKAINDSRFTIPKKNGRPTQAVYLYKLTFINRI